MKRVKQSVAGLLMVLGLTAVLPSVADEVVATAAGGWFAVDSRTVKDTTLAGGVIVGGATNIVLQSSPDAWGESAGTSANIAWQSTSGNNGTVAEATTAREVNWTPEAHYGTITLTYSSGSVEKSAQFEVLESLSVGDGVNAYIGGDGTCTITGSGDMASYDKPGISALWDYRNAITNVVIAGDVTSVGTNFFAYMKGIRSVEIGGAVTNVAQDAFYFCQGVTNLVIGANVQTVGDNAFERCNSLTTLYFGSKDLAEACTNAYKVTARITMDGDTPVVDSVPDIVIENYKKTLKGKVELSDADWTALDENQPIPTGYHFFKYEYIKK